jgi:four helix bundle protein
LGRLPLSSSTNLFGASHFAGMQFVGQNILDRTQTLALKVIQLCDDLPNKPSAWIIGKQVIRSATSVGAHVREGKHSRSALERLSKMSVAAQELEETRYWLELLRNARIPANGVPDWFFKETDELMAILFASMRTLRNRAP